MQCLHNWCAGQNKIHQFLWIDWNKSTIDRDSIINGNSALWHSWSKLYHNDAIIDSNIAKAAQLCATGLRTEEAANLVALLFIRMILYFADYDRDHDYNYNGDHNNDALKSVLEIDINNFSFLGDQKVDKDPAYLIWDILWIEEHTTEDISSVAILVVCHLLIVVMIIMVAMVIIMIIMMEMMMELPARLDSPLYYSQFSAPTAPTGHTQLQTLLPGRKTQLLFRRSWLGEAAAGSWGCREEEEEDGEKELKAEAGDCWQTDFRDVLWVIELSCICVNVKLMC